MLYSCSTVLQSLPDTATNYSSQLAGCPFYMGAGRVGLVFVLDVAVVIVVMREEEEGEVDPATLIQ